MSILLNQLLDTIQYTEIQMLAGEDNLSQAVKWVHVMETLEASDFIEAGELVVCTGVGITDESVFYQMIQALLERGAVGFIATIGPFIREVPADIVQYCRDKHFPLFTLPWKIHIAEIMQLFCMSITRSEQDAMELAAAMKNAFFFPMQENLYLPKLIEKGLKPKAAYQVGVLSVERVGEILTLLEQHLSEKGFGSVICFTLDTYIVFVFSGTSVEMMEQFKSFLSYHLIRQEQAKEEYYFGIGNPVDSLTKLHVSYYNAERIVRLQEKGLLSREQSLYTDLGIYSVLLQVTDTTVLQEYYKALLAPLLEYDKTTGNTLGEILYYYLSHNGSVQETAAHFYVHRNTINYKLGKAAQLLKMDLSDWNNRYQLILAFQCMQLV